MPVPPPPPPPPPAAAVKAPIPKSNMQLLQSIEKGTRLKKVPESSKNDRSSGLVGTGVAAPRNDNITRPLPKNVMSKPVINNGSNDLQSQLKSQLFSMKPNTNYNNDNHDRRLSIPSNNNVSVRSTSGQFLNKCPPPIMANHVSVSNNGNGAPPITNNHSSNSINWQTSYPVVVSNKPVVARGPPLPVANKPAPAAPTASNVLRRAPPPNQPQTNTNNRAPPPPPTNSKPVQRNSVSMDPIGRTSMIAYANEPMSRARPLSQAPSLDSSSRHSSVVSTVTRTTANPPPPVSGHFKPCMTRAAISALPPAPPVPSRVSGQYMIAPGAVPPYKVLDRAPPPPPPPQPSAAVASASSSHRFSHIPDSSSFEGRFRFPDESLFPLL